MVFHVERERSVGVQGRDVLASGVDASSDSERRLIASRSIRASCLGTNDARISIWRTIQENRRRRPSIASGDDEQLVLARVWSRRIFIGEEGSVAWVAVAPDPPWFAARFSTPFSTLNSFVFSDGYRRPDIDSWALHSPFYTTRPRSSRGAVVFSREQFPVLSLYLGADQSSLRVSVSYAQRRLFYRCT